MNSLFCLFAIFRKCNSFTLPNITNHQNMDNENDSLDENKTNHGANHPNSDTKPRSSRNKQQQQKLVGFGY